MTVSSNNRSATSDPAASATDAGAPALLTVDGLQTFFFTRQGIAKAVDGISFSVRPAETLAIVGESGCGKSVTALSLMRLVPDPPGRIVGGTVILAGTDLLALDEGDAQDRDFRPADDRPIGSGGGPSSGNRGRRLILTGGASDPRPRRPHPELDDVGCGHDERHTPTYARAGEPIWRYAA